MSIGFGNKEKSEYQYLYFLISYMTIIQAALISNENKLVSLNKKISPSKMLHLNNAIHDGNGLKVAKHYNNFHNFHSALTSKSIPK